MIRIGDLVSINATDNQPEKKGLVVGFNKKGEGGKDYVHVLVDGTVSIFLRFAVEIINEAS